MGLYKENKAAKVGEQIECPVCHTKFVKKQYSQAFCSTKCKDAFHNGNDGDRHRDGIRPEKKMNETRKFLKVEFKYDSKGHIHFINPSCDEMPATDFVKIMGALSKLEESEAKDEQL
jgi:ribosomal protein L37AE/L43A